MRNYEACFSALAEMFSEEDIRKACTYLPHADDFHRECEQMWMEEVNSRADEPICPFTGWMECNCAGSLRCYECEFAHEMYRYKLYEQSGKLAGPTAVDDVDNAEWHDDCDQWELDCAEGSDEDRARAEMDWFEFCEKTGRPFC